MKGLVSRRLSDGVIRARAVFGAEPLIEEADASATSVTGISRDALIGSRLFDLFSEPLAEALRREYARDGGLAETFSRFPCLLLRECPGSGHIEIGVFRLPPEADEDAENAPPGSTLYELVFRDKSLSRRLSECAFKYRSAVQTGQRHPPTGLAMNEFAQECLDIFCGFAREHPEPPMALGLVAAGWEPDADAPMPTEGDSGNMLAAVSCVLRSALRADDLIVMAPPAPGRPLAPQEGGVFAVGLYACGLFHAYRILERLRAEVAVSGVVRSVCYPLRREVIITGGCVSVSAAAEAGEGGREQVLLRAHEVLRAAQAFGGDRTAVHAREQDIARFLYGGKPEARLGVEAPGAYGMLRLGETRDDK